MQWVLKVSSRTSSIQVSPDRDCWSGSASGQPVVLDLLQEEFHKRSPGDFENMLVGTRAVKIRKDLG